MFLPILLKPSWRRGNPFSTATFITLLWLCMGNFLATHMELFVLRFKDKFAETIKSRCRYNRRHGRDLWSEVFNSARLYMSSFPWLMSSSGNSDTPAHNKHWNTLTMYHHSLSYEPDNNVGHRLGLSARKQISPQTHNWCAQTPNSYH